MRAVHVTLASGCIAGVITAGCGGTVVFDEEGGSSDGGGSAASQVTVGPSGGPTSTSGPSTSATATDASAASAASSGTGASADGSCVALSYCECLAASPTCRVIAEDCFCSCDEPCSEPCDCDCAGGLFLMCAPGTIEDPGALETGVWLVGEGNGGNHFSWLRFDSDGTLFALDGRDLPDNEPWFGCSGVGSWSFDGAEGVRLDLPGGCDSTTLTFGDWYPIGAFGVDTPQEVFLFDSGRGVTLGAWRFPDDQCSPDFTTCADPMRP